MSELRNSATPEEEQTTLPRRAARVIARVVRGVTCRIAWLITAASLVAVLVRLTIRDHDGWFASIHYLLQWHFLAALFAAAALLWIVLFEFWHARLCMIATLLAALFWAATHVRVYSCEQGDQAEFHEPAESSLEVVVWNVNHGRAGWDLIASELLLLDADLILLVEAKMKREKDRVRWRERFKHYDINISPGGTILMSRGKFLRIVDEPLPPSISHATHAWTEINEHVYRLMAVDLDASPLYDKRYLMHAVRLGAKSRDDENGIRFERGPADLIAGDFNTPTDSRWMAPLRADYDHAFLSSGRGIATTWLDWFPAFAIDHLWVRKNRLRPTCTEHRTSPGSDHAQVISRLVPIR